MHRRRKKNNILNSTVNQIQSTLPKVLSTSIPTTISKEIKSTSLIRTTISYNIHTTIPSTIQESNGETSIVCLGYSQFKIEDS